MQGSLLFEALSSPERAALLAAMRPVTAAPGSAIITQGDAVADHFYVLEKAKYGSFSACKEGLKAGIGGKGGPLPPAADPTPTFFISPYP